MRRFAALLCLAAGCGRIAPPPGGPPDRHPPLLTGATPDSLRQALVDSFTTAVPRSPVIDRDTICSYYWRGSAGTVTDRRGAASPGAPDGRIVPAARSPCGCLPGGCPARDPPYNPYRPEGR